MHKLISCKNLYWRIDPNNQSEILSDITLELENREMVVVRGAGGSGKSSLMRILAGVERLSSGELFYSGEDHAGKAGIHMKRVLSKIGYIPEETVFINSKDIQNNIDFVLKLQGIPDSARTDRIMHILQLTGLIEKRKMYVRMLSMTEKKLFSFAVMLARKVELFLCDFNLTGFGEEEDIIKLLKEETHRGAGVIVTARSGADIRGARVRNIDIKDGKIV